MAEPELPQTILDFRKLSQGITKLREVLKAIEAGKISDLSGKPEEIFGPVPPDVQVDTDALSRFVDQKIETASEDCIKTLETALRAEVAAMSLFKATAIHDEAKGQSLPDNDVDLANAQARLARLTIFSDDYQEEAWEDEGAANQTIAAHEPVMLASYQSRLEAGERQHVLKAQALEAVTETALKAGLARLASAEALMAAEILRLQNHTDAAQTILDNPDHKNALKNIVRNLDWADAMLKNADEASPVMRRRWGFENDDSGTPPPQPRLN